MLCSKFTQNVGAPGNDVIRCALRELGGEQFLVAITQTCRAVYDKDAVTLGCFENVGSVEKFVIKGRVLAHQDNVQAVQRGFLFLAQLVPVGGVGKHLEWAHAAVGFAVDQVEVLRLQVEELPVALGGGQQHGQ